MIETVTLSRLLRCLSPLELKTAQQYGDLAHLPADVALSYDMYVFPIDCTLAVVDAYEMDLALIYPGEAGFDMTERTGFQTRLVVRRAGAAYLVPKFVLERRLLSNLEPHLDELRRAVTGRMMRTLQFNHTKPLHLRVARYLLNLRSDYIELSQQVIADALGVRREGVTEAFNGLKSQGLIEHQRSKIRILNPTALSDLVNSGDPTWTSGHASVRTAVKEPRYGNAQEN